MRIVKVTHPSGRPYGVEIHLDRRGWLCPIRLIGCTVEDIRQDGSRGAKLILPGLKPRYFKVEQLEHWLNAEEPLVELFGTKLCLFGSDELDELKSALEDIVSYLTLEVYSNQMKVGSPESKR